MPDESRSVKNLREDITYARAQLLTARQDGGAEKITYWRNRTDELLDRMLETRSDQVELI
jgi:hypothetical protein